MFPPPITINNIQQQNINTQPLGLDRNITQNSDINNMLAQAHHNYQHQISMCFQNYMNQLNYIYNLRTETAHNGVSAPFENSDIRTNNNSSQPANTSSLKRKRIDDHTTNKKPRNNNEDSEETVDDIEEIINTPSQNVPTSSTTPLNTAADQHYLPQESINNPPRNNYEDSEETVDDIGEIINSPSQNVPTSSKAPLNIPIEQHHLLQERMNNIPTVSVAKGNVQIELGQYPIVGADTLILTSDSKIVDSQTGVTIAYFLKGVLPKEKVQVLTIKLKNIPLTNTQGGDAAGPFDLAKMSEAARERISKNGPIQTTDAAHVRDGSYRRTNPIKSTTIGFNIAGKNKEHAGYNVEITSRYPLFKETIEPFFNEMSDYYSIVAPEWHQAQEQIVTRCNRRIGNSVFTHAQFNRGEPNTEAKKTNDSQTACHTDKSHAEQGHEFFAVLGDDFEGGKLLLPEYNLALELAAGDVVVFDGKHQIHGNTPLTQGVKLSVIFFVHKKLEEAQLPDLVNNDEGNAIPNLSDQDWSRYNDMLQKRLCPVTDCSQQGKVYASRKIASKHLHKIHKICEKCMLSFPNRDSFAIHEYNNHKQKK